MKLVINSNILFSFFWNDSFTKKLMLLPSLELYTPFFFFKEMDKYTDDILSKTKLSTQQFKIFKEKLSEAVNFVTEGEYSEYINEGIAISPDTKDADFFALALYLNCPIWSKDKALKKQSKVEVFNTSELLKELGLE